MQAEQSNDPPVDTGSSLLLSFLTRCQLHMGSKSLLQAEMRRIQAGKLGSLLPRVE